MINRPVTALARASGPPSGSCLAHDDPLTSTHTPRRRFSIDRLVYKVLAKALQLAAEYVESHPEGAREEGPGQEAVPLRSLFGVSHAWPAFLEAEDSAPDALRAEPRERGQPGGLRGPSVASSGRTSPLGGVAGRGVVGSGGAGGEGGRGGRDEDSETVVARVEERERGAGGEEDGTEDGEGGGGRRGGGGEEEEEGMSWMRGSWTISEGTMPEPYMRGGGL